MSKKIVIDSGHGGEDGGASGNGIIEKDLTLKISKYMKQRFDELGIPNQMTRTEDVTLNPTDRVKKVLSFYGDGKDVIVLSNHINAGGGDYPSGKLTFFEKKIKLDSYYLNLVLLIYNYFLCLVLSIRTIF